MALEKKTIEYYEEHDLNALIEETFGKPYVIQQSGDMLANDTWTFFEVDGRPGFHYDADHKWVPTTVEEEEAEIAAWQASVPERFHSPGREPDPYAGLLLNALYRRGLLEVDEDAGFMGIYIHVSW